MQTAPTVQSHFRRCSRPPTATSTEPRIRRCDGGAVFRITPSGTLQRPLQLRSGPRQISQWTDSRYRRKFLRHGLPGRRQQRRHRFQDDAWRQPTVLYNFCSQSGCADGSQPNAPLIQGTDGNFYGTTSLGGTSNYGTVFKITPSGTLTTLHQLQLQRRKRTRSAPLIQGSDGNFYGTTYAGGPSNPGAIFGMTPAGALTSAA